MRVEMAMQKMAIEQVQEERARGEKVLAETVKQVEERCAQELKQAVAEARKEEQFIAAEKIKDLIQSVFLIDSNQLTHAMEICIIGHFCLSVSLLMSRGFFHLISPYLKQGYVSH